jgi:hypothetical protein
VATWIDEAVMAVATSDPPALRARASRRPARRIVSSSRSVPRKFTVSFGPGREPARRSTASINRPARTLIFWAS